MIGHADLIRFCETSSQIAGGDVEAQLLAWNIDSREFFAFANQWATTAAASGWSDPKALLIAFFAGFELGYRSCAEAGGLDNLDVPDSP